MPEFVPRPALSATIHESLLKSNIPLIDLESACSGCSIDDGDEIDEYPDGFDVDLDTELLGTMSGYSKQILISTGASDWPREVTEVKDSLAEHVYNEYKRRYADSETKIEDGVDRIPGVYAKEEQEEAGISLDSLSISSRPAIQLPGTRLSVLNSSFLSSSDQHVHKSVFVFPDFISVHHVEESTSASADLIENYLVKDALYQSKRTTSWPLPYQAVVLICSHKRRDKRCHQAAPLLLAQFHHHLEANDLEIDERGDDITDDGPPIEEWDATTRSKRLRESLQGVRQGGGRVGVFKVSHVGGHRYAGNVIIYFPNGTSIWYGRVTPRDVGAIVQSTIIGGKVIPELLRGAIGITGKSSKAGVLAW